jgi:hypothetical protein
MVIFGYCRVKLFSLNTAANVVDFCRIFARRVCATGDLYDALSIHSMLYLHKNSD